MIMIGGSQVSDCENKRLTSDTRVQIIAALVQVIQDFQSYNEKYGGPYWIGRIKEVENALKEFKEKAYN